MASKDESAAGLRQFQARFLAKETGITEAEAMELIELLGADMTSLLREARILKKAKDRLPRP
jgi:hypothetical protein